MKYVIKETGHGEYEVFASVEDDYIRINVESGWERSVKETLMPVDEYGRHLGQRYEDDKVVSSTIRPFDTLEEAKEFVERVKNPKEWIID